MPPLRNAPTGTSLTRCRRSASSILRLQLVAAAASSVPVELRLLAPVASSARMRGAPPASSTSRWPGGSLWMPSNIDSGASISRSARYWSSAARFIRGAPPVEGEQRLDLGCEGEAALAVQRSRAASARGGRARRAGARRFTSQSTNANMPRRCSSSRSPWRSYSAMMTSQSLWVRNAVAVAARARWRSSR